MRTVNIRLHLLIPRHGHESRQVCWRVFAHPLIATAVNMFLELGLPFILRYIAEWRSGKTSLKDLKNMTKRHHDEPASPTTEADAEKLFLDKVERELGLPDYSLFSQSRLTSVSFMLTPQPITPRW